MTERTVPAIRCKKCATVFPPDVSTLGRWICPSCKARNPNLYYHYLSVAYAGILGLFLALPLEHRDSALYVSLMTASCFLLLFMIATVFRSRSPWENKFVRNIIWIAFGVPAAATLVALLVLHEKRVGLALFIYSIIFIDTFWLSLQSTRLSAATH